MALTYCSALSNSYRGRQSDVAWVKHDSAGSTMRAWWQMLLEFRANNARVPMWAADFAPDDSKLAVLDLLFGLVNIGTPLSKVKFGVVASQNTLNLDERCPWVVIDLASQVAANHTLGIQPGWLLASCLFLCGHHDSTRQAVPFGFPKRHAN